MRATRSTTAAALVMVASLAAGALAGCAPGTSAAGPGDSAMEPEATASASAPATTPAPSASPSGGVESPSATPDPSSPEPSPSEEPSAEPVLASGDQGDQVRELQSRLAQLDWFTGDITDTYGETTQTAVAGFQAKRGLEDTGAVDEETWSSLTSMTQEPTDDEMHNRLTPGPALFEEGSEGEEVRDIQARLKQIGWFSGDVTEYYGSDTSAAVEGFQERRDYPTTAEVDQRTLDGLQAMTREPTEAELGNEPPEDDEAEEEDGAEDDEQGEDAAASGLDSRCLTGRALCISKETSQMQWVVDGEVQSSFDVRFGSELTPTRDGAFSVGWKSRDHVSTLYDTAMPYAMFFSGGQAVHYSADFAANGYNGASHGCVNVRDEAGIAALFDQVSERDKVIVY